MTELAHASADKYGEQLELDIDVTGTAEESPVPVEIIEQIVHSPAYRELRELRDTAREQRRSGARAIARHAFAALREGRLTHDEYARLFPLSDEEQAEARPPATSADEELEFDAAQRAAGEAVRHPWDEDD